jgi:hypothetical protein
VAFNISYELDEIAPVLHWIYGLTQADFAMLAAVAKRQYQEKLLKRDGSDWLDNDGKQLYRYRPCSASAKRLAFDRGLSPAQGAASLHRLRYTGLLLSESRGTRVSHREVNRDALALLKPQLAGVIARYKNKTKRKMLKHPEYGGIDWTPLLKEDAVPSADIQSWMAMQDYANPVALCFNNTLDRDIAYRWLFEGHLCDIGKFDESEPRLGEWRFRVGPIPPTNRSGKIQENREEYPAACVFYGSPAPDKFMVIPPLGWQSPSECENEDEEEKDELDEELADVEVA